MTAEQFAYWLQGFSEVNGAPPTADQWKVIQDHLKLVFQKVTPIRPVQAPGFRLLGAWAAGQEPAPG
jgi:hypothetical protein